MELDDDLEDDEIMIDSEPRYSGGEAQNSFSIDEGRRLSLAPPIVDETKRWTERGGSCPPEQTPVAQRPLRLLENEKVHLHNATLKLTDFEVRGTVGA
jgi:hypothetical protein